MSYKVSVIVPIYNTEQYLDRCINSLLGQSLEDVEIILVNDASTDGSLKIIRQYEKEHSNIIVIDSPINKRQGGARNLGINRASGEFLAFVDSDDWVDTTMYEKLYGSAKKMNSQIADCDYCTANENEIVKRFVSNRPQDTGKMNARKYKQAILRDGRMVTKIYHRSLFTEHNLRYPEELLYEDNAIGALLMLFASNISKVEEVLYYYRIDNVSTTRSLNNFNYFDRLETARILLKNAKYFGFYQNYKEEFDFRFFELFLLNTVRRCLKYFSPPLPNKIVEIHNEILSVMPNYHLNKYYRKLRWSTKLRTRAICKFPLFFARLYSFKTQLRATTKAII